MIWSELQNRILLFLQLFLWEHQVAWYNGGLLLFHTKENSAALLMINPANAEGVSSEVFREFERNVMNSINEDIP